MKFFALLFLLGFASVSLGEVFVDEVDDALRGYNEALEFVPHLKSFVQLAEEGDDDDVKTKVGKDLKDRLKDILEKIKDAIEHGKFITADLRVNLQEIRQKLKDMHIDIGDKAKELIKTIKEKAKDYWQKILERLGLKHSERKLVEKRSLQELWEKIKDYFKDLHIDIKEKYFKFAQWIRDHVKAGLDKSKTKIENIKEIAKEFLKHTKEVSKEVAIEALEFLRPYKEDLGGLYDQVKEAIKDMIKKQE